MQIMSRDGEVENNPKAVNSAKSDRGQPEVQMELIADAISGVITYVDREHHCLYVNKMASEWFSKTRKELTGKHLKDIIGEEAYQQILPEIARALSGEQITYERFLPYRYGPRFVQGSYVPDVDENGNVRGYFGLILDISDRMRAEQALVQSEERYRAFIGQSTEGIWRFELSEPIPTDLPTDDQIRLAYERGYLAECNDAMARQHGLSSAGELVGVKLGDLLVPEDPNNYAFLKAFIEGGYTLSEAESHEKGADGEDRYFLNNFVGFIENGKFVRAWGTQRDVTETRRVEKALRESERKAAEEYQALLLRIVPLAQTLGTARDLVSVYRGLREFVCSSMPCSAFFVSFYEAEGSLRHAAYAWGEQGELDVSELPPMTLTEDGGPNSQAVFQRKSVIVNRYMDQMKDRPHIILQENGVNPNSSLVVPMMVMDRVTGTFEVQAYENEAFTKAHVIALEMVANLAAVAIENVRLIETEASARSEAEAANRLKDEFLSILSHELRTPLNAILGWVRMLRTGALDGERSERALEVIERNTRQQSNLIEDLLDVSRIISGKMRIEKDLIDIAAVVTEAAETVRPIAESKNVEFEFTAPGEPMFMHGDAVRLQQVVTNLLQNAIKFTQPEGRVELSCGRDGFSAVIKVKDNGVGIEGDFLPFIFDRFTQADASTKRVFTGLGLGLTIVRNIVELHEGEIHAESGGPNKGSAFTARLPLAENRFDAGIEAGTAPHVN